MKIKKENLLETYKLLKQLGVPVYKSFSILKESRKPILVSKAVRNYIENSKNKVIIMSAKSKKFDTMTYILEKSGNYYYLTREVQIDKDLPDEKSALTIVLDKIHEKQFKNIDSPKAEEVVSLGDRLTDEGVFGI